MNQFKIIGNPSVFYSESRKCWVGELRYIDCDGKKRRKTCTGKSRRDAMRLIQEKEDELVENFGVEKSEPLKDFMTHWLNDVEKIKLKPSAFSRKQNVCRVQIIPFLLTLYFKEYE